MKGKLRFVRSVLLAGMLAAASFLTACSGGLKIPAGKAEIPAVSENGANSDIAAQIVAAAEYPQEPVYRSEEERWAAGSEREIPEAFQKAYSDFVYETSSKLMEESSENVVYAPLGFYYVLAAAAQGAEGSTRDELLDLLGYAGQEAGLPEDCRMAFEKLYHVPNPENIKVDEWGETAPQNLYHLRIAGSIWADDGLELKQDFADCAAEKFYMDVYRADLQAQDTADAMADWVKDRTNGVMDPRAAALSVDQVLSLRNTVYFKDEWLDKFLMENTREDIFTAADGSQVTCDFMNRETGSQWFRKGSNYTMSFLSLKNSQMFFVLPDEGVNVHELVQTPEVLREILEGESGQMMGEVVWKVPKFSFGNSLELGNLLKDLGIQAAFDQNAADFSGISEQKPLYLSAVNQDAHIGIDENGVEAAAFTELAWAGAALPQGRADMILDRPFLYVIRHGGEILFVGICEKP